VNAEDQEKFSGELSLKFLLSSTDTTKPKRRGRYRSHADKTALEEFASNAVYSSSRIELVLLKLSLVSGSSVRNIFCRAIFFVLEMEMNKLKEVVWDWEFRPQTLQTFSSF